MNYPDSRYRSLKADINDHCMQSNETPVQRFEKTQVVCLGWFGGRSAVLVTYGVFSAQFCLLQYVPSGQVAPSSIFRKA